MMRPLSYSRGVHLLQSTATREKLDGDKKANSLRALVRSEWAPGSTLADPGVAPEVSIEIAGSEPTPTTKSRPSETTLPPHYSLESLFAN